MKALTGPELEKVAEDPGGGYGSIRPTLPYSELSAVSRVSVRDRELWNIALTYAAAIAANAGENGVSEDILSKTTRPPCEGECPYPDHPAHIACWVRDMNYREEP